MLDADPLQGAAKLFGLRRRASGTQAHGWTAVTVILDATMAILAEDGYQGLTIDGVAARANVGRPNIYRRWPSKPALVVAALARSTGLAPAPIPGPCAATWWPSSGTR